MLASESAIGAQVSDETFASRYDETPNNDPVQAVLAVIHENDHDRVIDEMLNLSLYFMRDIEKGLMITVADAGVFDTIFGLCKFDQTMYRPTRQKTIAGGVHMNSKSFSSINSDPTFFNVSHAEMFELLDPDLKNSFQKPSSLKERNKRFLLRMEEAIGSPSNEVINEVINEVAPNAGKPAARVRVTGHQVSRTVATPSVAAPTEAAVTTGLAQTAPTTEVTQWNCKTRNKTTVSRHPSELPKLYAADEHDLEIISNLLTPIVKHGDVKHTSFKDPWFYDGETNKRLRCIQSIFRGPLLSFLKLQSNAAHQSGDPDLDLHAVFSALHAIRDHVSASRAYTGQEPTPDSTEAATSKPVQVNAEEVLVWSEQSKFSVKSGLAAVTRLIMTTRLCLQAAKNCQK